MKMDHLMPLIILLLSFVNVRTSNTISNQARILLNYQNISFDDDKVTLSWEVFNSEFCPIESSCNEMISSENPLRYKLDTLSVCNGNENAEVIDSLITTESFYTLSSEQLESNGTLLYLNLTAWTVSGQYFARLNPLLRINVSDVIRDTVLISPGEDACVNIPQNKIQSIVSISWPAAPHYHFQNCACPLLYQCSLPLCECIIDPENSALNLTLHQCGANISTPKICAESININSNNSKIFFYQLSTLATTCNAVHVVEELISQAKIQVKGAPSQPSIESVNNGRVCYSVHTHPEFPVLLYNVTLRDVTATFTAINVVQEIQTQNCTSFGYSENCAPYWVSVSAYNALGWSDVSIRSVNGFDPVENCNVRICKCLIDKVSDLIIVSDIQTEYSGVHLNIVCSPANPYLANATLKVTISLENINTEPQRQYFQCDDHSVAVKGTFGSQYLHPQKHYTIEVSGIWTSANKECICQILSLQSAYYDGKAIFFGALSAISCTILLLVAVTLTICIKLCMKKLHPGKGYAPVRTNESKESLASL